MSFYFYVFLFFVRDFSKACIGERNYFGSFFVGSRERERERERETENKKIQ